MKQNDLERKKTVINWTPYSRKNLSCEGGEAERVINEVLGIKSNDPRFHDILKSLGNKILGGELVPLSDEIWAKLENTDSWSNVSKGDLKKAEELSKYYKKNFSVILNAIKDGSGILAPIIFKTGDRMHLMSGNTRLMIARGLKQRPEVIIIEYP